LSDFDGDQGAVTMQRLSAISGVLVGLGLSTFIAGVAATVWSVTNLPANVVDHTYVVLQVLVTYLGFTFTASGVLVVGGLLLRVLTERADAASASARLAP
jgi:hypothetical protein